MTLSRFTITFILITAISFFSYGQSTYELNPRFPVHDLQKEIKVIEDTNDKLSPEIILNDTTLTFSNGNNLPKYLNVGSTYWAKLKIIASDTLKDWTLHFEDRMIGAPAWSKSNGKVDVYAYQNGHLLFHKKTGVEYPKNERDIKKSWVMNRVGLEKLPINKPTVLIIKVQGNSMGYPAYFNLTARGPSQPFYHQIYQYHNAFNIFMFGVTFIIFLYHLLQYVYLRQKVFMWFSLWLLFCLLTMAMTVGFIIGDVSEFRYPIWLVLANGIFYTFWFFGRSFMDSKRKFPKLDKFILGVSLFILLEIAIMVLYVLIVDPQTSYTNVGYHYQLLNVYTVLSLILSIILILKKDLFARYFGIGSLIGSLALVIGVLWSLGIIKPFADPFAIGMFLQVVIYSFGIAYRQQQLDLQSQREKLESQKNLAEIQRIKDLDEMKTKFFTNISHEFRTPLSLIIGPLQNAKRNAQNKNEISISEGTYQLIQQNSNRLQGLIDQLLELSKIESGVMHLNLIQGGLIKFLKSLVFSFESLSDRSNISLITSFPEEHPSAYFDKDKLDKIVVNLVSNAFKYTPNGGTVMIGVDYTESHIILNISDTGKGIDNNQINRIFDRFYRVEGTEEKGSGIGLALTKELVELLNGQISVNSKKNEGTTFKVRLPYTLNLLPKPISIETSANSTEELSCLSELNKFEESQEIKALDERELEGLPLVLIVEDNKDLRNFVKTTVEEHYKVLTAEDGQKGERMALEHVPDIVITDVMMPKMDGYQLCSNLKKNPKTSHIPIIMLTAKAGQTHKMEGLTQGVDSYLTKPIDIDELHLRMKNLIENREKIWEHFKSLDIILIDDLNLKSLDDKFLQDVTKFIREHMDDEQLNVDDLSREVGFSRSQLHRKLKALTDKSANQLIIEMRLNEARQMLLKKTATVSEAAYAVGYSNLSYFTKSFKDKFGILPSKI